MKYKKLGKSGAIVSELCLGTMTFGKGTSEKDAVRMVHQFLDYGGNFIDTADVYVGGKSEEIVGEAIKDRRSDVVLATKVRMKTGENPNDVGYSRKRVMEGVEQSLKRLKTDYIDLYQLHVWDHLTPIEETLRTLNDLISSGKVRYIGCSNFLAWQLMKSLSISEQKNIAKFITIQPQYSLLHREMDREMLSLCQEEGIGILPWAPLGGGFLTGKYDSLHKPDEEWRLVTAGPGEYYWENKALERNFIILEKVKKIAAEIDKTPAQVALNWLLMKEGITSPIFGARTLEQFEENINAAGWQLSKEHFEELDQISALPPEYPNRFIEKFKRDI
ncbi:aldo/keto reductase [Alteribacillus bidgolensis]|uniref:Predicted oxidoreductase n=1 Tax=Alteribacillus bidgolensis TaxID=930129 RepID=A0A1G8CI32_9BACI|nr:aldo/keto reductase [Alteribacillus bidgolensis]SDH45105.1 Predicted oxidoreductase [Alteribacillus bidgolensis]